MPRTPFVMRPFQPFWQDIRMAIRILRKSPAATGLSILSIALGIGLTTGVFSLGDALLLRPFPFARPGEVFQVLSMGDDGRQFLHGWDDYRDMARAGAGMLDMAAYQGRGVMLAEGDATEAVLANPVTPNFFTFLGVRAELGRATVDSTAGRPGFVMGHRLWQRRFGGDPKVVGKTVMLNGKALVVNGVMPAQFTGLQRTVAFDVFVGMHTWFDVLGHAEEKQGRDGQFEFVARLKPGEHRNTRQRCWMPRFAVLGSTSRLRRAAPEPGRKDHSHRDGSPDCSTAAAWRWFWAWCCSWPA